MLSLLNKNFFFSKKTISIPILKFFMTLFLLFLFKLGSSIPLPSIDMEALQKSFLQFEKTNSSILQILSMYTGGGGKILLSPFSLGIVPFINASILIDFLMALFPALEKLQSDEIGKRQLIFYKKIVTLFFACIQSYFLICTLKSYFYVNEIFNFFLIFLQLVSGSLIMVWLTAMIDKKGIGNGISLVVFINIVSTLLSRIFFSTVSLNDEVTLALLIAVICFLQSAQITIPIVSARQLAFLETNKKNSIPSQVELKDSTLLIRFTQAGIFPIIIASNLLPIVSSFLVPEEKMKNWVLFFYYLAIILFNYFYTTVFWDPEKISEQLRKSSVSIVKVTPGRQTITYLKKVVCLSSILGGGGLCSILYFYDFIKERFDSSFLSQLSISSLIILVGVIFDLQKTLRGMYKTIL